MKNVVNYILSAQKKIFVVAFLAVFSSFYTMVWGAIDINEEYSYNSTTNTLTIHKAGDFASGVMTDFSSGGNYSNWGTVSSKATKIIVSDGISHIGAYAFQGFNKVTSVTIPSSVTSIGEKAFASCTKVANIYYAASPNNWASIDFNGTTADSHPFNPSTARPRRIYFEGSTSNYADNLVFTSNLTTIKKYAFAKTNLKSISIPSSVTSIGEYAFYKDTIDEMAINRSTPPTLSNNGAIYFSSTAKLYVPTDAKTNYTVNSLWRYSTTKNTNGARESNIIEKPVNGTVDGQSWSIDKNGVLTISGSGALTTSFLKADGASQYPYYYFRFLVDKVVITGGITGLSNILQRAQAMRTLEFQQNNIPTKTATIPTDYIYADGTLKMLFPYTAVENVYPESWSSYKRQLSNAANIDQSEDNVSLLAALHNNLTEPFDMNLTRTLSNTMYNTYCSPIDMSAEEVTALFGEGTYLVELDAENTGMNEDDELVIAFKDATEIIAGTPYLIMPANNVANPSFTNVDPSKVAAEEGVVETEHVDFHGTLNKRTISETEIENQSIVILTASLSETTGYQLFNWANGGTLKGMRAYWELKSDKAKASIRRPVLRINYQAEGENTATGVENVQSDNVQCTKVLRNGQIYLIYEGQMYDVQGKRIR